MTADKIQEIMIYQSTPYNLTPVPSIQKYIEENLIDSRKDEDLFEQSLRLEPRERYVDSRGGRVEHEADNISVEKTRRLLAFCKRVGSCKQLLKSAVVTKTCNVLLYIYHDILYGEHRSRLT
jgi:hypothetical protein